MGSLFKLRDYWYARYGGEEFTNTGPLVTGNVDNHPSGGSKIVFGSFSGILRIMRPSRKGAALPEDMLLEKDFGEPILQLACRSFEPAGKGGKINLLAILFPKRLALFRVKEEANGGTCKTEATALGTFHSINLCYETPLEHLSYNFTYGTFGRASHEMICVQSMDGQLTVIDRNTVLFRRFLPINDFLLPACLTYCPSRDYFITCNSAKKLMSYTFCSLASERWGSDTREGEFNTGEATKNEGVLKPVWTFALSEDAVAIEVFPFSCQSGEDEVNIVVLTHHALFVFKLNGQLLYTRRLDVMALCLCFYEVPDTGAFNLLVGTVTGSVLVFSHSALEWSAKMSEGAPICLQVAELLGVKGLIVSLNTEGAVTVNYLGTDPEEKPNQPLECKESGYAEALAELRQVHRSIKEIATSQQPSTEKEASKSIVNLSWEIAKNIGGLSEYETIIFLTLRNNSRSVSVSNLIIIVQVTEPIEVVTSRYAIKSIDPRCGARVRLHFKSLSNEEGTMPTSLDSRVVVLFSVSGGIESSVSTVIHLPLALVAKPIAFVDVSKFTLQIDTQKTKPPSLLDIFPEMARSVHISENLLAIRYVSGEIAVIFVSRNGAKFRLLAATTQALWLLVCELQGKLLQFYGADIQISTPSPLPVESLFNAIDKHMEVRRELYVANTNLAKVSRAFVALQRRLLIIVRTVELMKVDVTKSLLEECYINLQRCISTVCELLSRRKRAAAAVCCCSRLLAFILLTKCGGTLTNPEDVKLIESVFTCPINTDGEIDWEEATDAALGRLLGDNRGDCALVTTEVPSSSNISLDFNLDRLKLRINHLCDKLLSGAVTTFLK
uniref:Uncharacterized protein TCIL3000_11_14760 n=1 Tax=Trypanosoma congolense (strain IL3000) TaxID=1068625 RepID=G0V2T7_TRYCI|nr:unnamed protein product [Trypanosoma congolense IL3000]